MYDTYVLPVRSLLHVIVRQLRAQMRYVHIVGTVWIYTSTCTDANMRTKGVQLNEQAQTNSEACTHTKTLTMQVVVQ